MAVKITGVRSIQAKLLRVAEDLGNDAERIAYEHPDRAGLAHEMRLIAKRVALAARSC